MLCPSLLLDLLVFLHVVYLLSHDGIAYFESVSLVFALTVHLLQGQISTFLVTALLLQPIHLSLIHSRLLLVLPPDHS